MVLGYYNGRLRIAVHDVPRARRSEPPRRESLQLSLLHLSYSHSMSQPKLCVVRVVGLLAVLTLAPEHYVHLLMSTLSKVGRVSRKKQRVLTSSASCRVSWNPSRGSRSPTGCSERRT